MPSSSSSPRIGAMVSLAGVALILFGFFLPMLTGSNPQVPGRAHPAYEWQFVPVSSGFPLFALFAVPVALPLLGMLIVLATSVAALFRVPLPRLVWLRRAAAAWGLAIQLLFEVFVFLLAGIGYGRTEIAWGFVVVPLGFLITAIGVFVIEAHPSEVQVASSSPRIGAVVSLAGVALILLGFFLPIFTLIPQHVPVYEWQVNGDPSNVSLTVLFGVLAALPLLGMLIVLATSVAALFRVPLPRLVVLKRAAAAWGLATQLFFEVFAFLLIGRGGLEIAWGFVVVLLGFLITAIGVFVIEAHPSEVQVASSSPRIGAVVSLAGVALILLGFFLPMFTTEGPVYEWQVNGDPSNVSLTVLFGVLAALPLLGMLIVLATSVAALFRVPLPRLVWLKRAAAAWGLAIQLLFEVLVLLLVGYGPHEIAWGFVVVPLGFLIAVIGAFVVGAHQKQERAKHS